MQRIAVALAYRTKHPVDCAFRQCPACLDRFNICSRSSVTSESATKLEKATAAAMVRANSENSRPMSPSRNAIGTKTEIRTTVVATTANPTWRVPVEGRDERRFAEFTDAADDVLEHDDGIVDDEADCQHQRQQRQQVDGEAQAYKAP